MKGNVAIIAALSGELKPLVRHSSAKGWRRRKAERGVEVWEYRHAGGCWVAVCAGMGMMRAAAAFAKAEKVAGIDAVCSVGWAGALDAGLGVGAVRQVAKVIDTKTGERFEAVDAKVEWPVLVTTEYVADAREKQRLVASYGAALVDMEAAEVARIALGKGIPFHCIKAVSDDASAELPDLSGFIGVNGQMRMLPFLGHVAVRPGSWAGLGRLGRNSALAAKNLAESIYELLDPDGEIRRSGGNYTGGKRE
jgi:adenosylhomocysteine nucleosidase